MILYKNNKRKPIMKLYNFYIKEKPNKQTNKKRRKEIPLFSSISSTPPPTLKVDNIKVTTYICYRWTKKPNNNDIAK